MKKLHIIEATCTKNNGRSPMVEVIGNQTVKDFGLENALHFISSGTRADPKYDKVLPYNKVVLVLDKASSHGLMKPVDVDKERYKSDSDYRAIIRNNVYMAFRIMRPIEAALRDAALHDVGMKYDGKRTQTIVRDDVSLVLGMEQKHVDQINQIYEAEQNKPLFTTITGYAGVGGEIPDSVGNTDPSVYFGIRDRLCELMPKVVSRFKEEQL